MRFRNHITLLLSAFSAFSAVKSHSAERPNILFIAVDDLRPELACYGATHIHSPNIDALAASGLQFNRAYVQLAVCNPSRVSVLTGLRPDSSKVWTLDVQFRDTVPDITTLPAHFKANGYTALGYGKIFHNPWPDNQSWSEPHAWPEKSELWSDAAKQRLADFREEMRAEGKSEAAITRMRGPATEKVDLPDHEHIDGAIARQALAAMRRLAKSDQPFFLAAGFVRPHLPFVVPRKYWDLYDPEAIQLAPNTTFPENYPANVPAMNTMYELRDYMDYSKTPAAGEGLLTPAQQRELKHGYYASVSLIDAQVGLLLAELEKLGLADNTVVVLWSDHGWKLGEHGSWCKQTNYEIDARVPFIVRAPGVKANGQQTDALVELLDIYPTLCDLAGIEPPAHLEGKALTPLLSDPSSTIKDAAFSQYYRRQDGNHYMGYAMRTDRYRYVEWQNRETREVVAHELYDHQADPDENHNIAPDPSNQTLLAQLSKQLWAILPTPPPFPTSASSAPLREAQKPSRPQLVLTNSLPDPLKVTWLHPDGTTKPSGNGTIAPGATHRINTALSHRFQVENPKTDFKQTITVTKQTETITFSKNTSAEQRGTRNEERGTAARSTSSGQAPRPNILFLMADDWSHPHASILGDPTVKTPTFDRIAREGLLFESAFVASPSCTPSRHAVSSGQYHWRPGVGADLGSSMAADVPVYPDLLAEIGYQTGFSRKGTGPSQHTHRGNDPFGPKFETFEQFHKDRDPSKPFCFWYGAGEPHRPYRLGEGVEADIDLASIVIPPGLPDNEILRSDLADYYNRVQRYDSDSARMIALLEKSGELENTIIVMTGDNGMPFPRCKSTLYDMGTRVPLAIRWGARIKNPGRKVSGFTSLTDLAPTFLEATGIEIPVEMTGKSLMPNLLGAASTSREFVLTGVESHVYPRPRRALRTADFLLIRNYDAAGWPTGEVDGGPHDIDFKEDPWPASVPGTFSFAMDPSPTKQWMLTHRDGAESEHLYQLAFGTPPPIELYDLAKDPGQLNNIATDPYYATAVKTLRNQLTQQLRATNDPRYSKTDRQIDGSTDRQARSATHTTKQLKGWTLHIHKTLETEKPDVLARALEIIELQLDRVIEAVPPEALARLRTIPLYLNPPYPGIAPTAEYHPDAGWLRDHGRDPAMAKAMEFTNATILPFENRRMPLLVLHELAHAYHDQVLGFDHLEIIAAYQAAKASGIYASVKRTGYPDQEAYAITNEKEYFAEAAEAFFGTNDFYPFTREDLKKHDPAMHDLLARLWKVPAQPNAAGKTARPTAPPFQQHPVDFNHPPREYLSRNFHGWPVLVEKLWALRTTAATNH